MSAKGQGCIRFLDNEYKLNVLEQVVAKASKFEIEIGVECHRAHFDQSAIPSEWRMRFQVPVVTLHEGKYVFIIAPMPLGITDLTEERVELEKKKGKPTGKTITTTHIRKPFTAKVVTKYNLNDAKVVPITQAPAETAVQLAEAYGSKNLPPRKPFQSHKTPEWKPNNGFDKLKSNPGEKTFKKFDR